MDTTISPDTVALLDVAHERIINAVNEYRAGNAKAGEADLASALDEIESVLQVLAPANDGDDSPAATAYGQLPYESRREVDGVATEMVRNGVRNDQARFWARRVRVLAERHGRDQNTAPPDRTLTFSACEELGKQLEAAIVERYTLFSRAGGAPWDLYPVREHGEKLGETLRGAPEADLEAAMAPYLDPIKADLMRRGFPEEDAEGWCEEIAGESGMWMDGDPPAEWLALCGDEAPASP